MKTITFYKYLDKFGQEDMLSGKLPNLTGIMWYNEKEAKKGKRTAKAIDKHFKLYEFLLVTKEV